MRTLSVENIQFIQNYLQNSGVEYDDVLAEMTDHVASEIEMRLESENELFYDVFKTYMIQHKKALLNNVKKFRRRADKRAFLLLLKNLLNPIVLTSSFVIALVLFFISPYFSLVENRTLILLILIIIELLIFTPIYWKILQKKGKKYSCLVRLVLMITWFNYSYFNFLEPFFPEKYSVIFLMIFVVLNASFLVSSIQLAKYYRKNYQLS